jgi:hypothetical protein
VVLVGGLRSMEKINKQELLSAMADGYAKDGNASEKP